MRIDRRRQTQNLVTKNLDTKSRRHKIATTQNLSQQPTMAYLFRQLATEIWQRQHGWRFETHVSDSDMVLYFGATPIVCDNLWQLLESHDVLEQNAEPLHLLWALFEAKNYPRARELKSQLGVNRNTFVKYAVPIRRAMLKIFRHVVGQVCCICVLPILCLIIISYCFSMLYSILFF